jgi:HSP20 family molecular chaperone IbpA
MKEQPSGIPQIRTSNPLRLVDLEKINRHEQEVRGLIARRAYELFESRGRTPGNETEDWLRAEAELLQPLKLELTESNDAFAVRTPVPGFKAEELMLAVEPRRLRIAGKRESRSAAKGRTTEARHLFHVLDLGTEIDPSRVTAGLRGDMLELVLPKARAAQQARAATRVA